MFLIKQQFITIKGNYTHQSAEDEEGNVYIFSNRCPNTGYGYVLLKNEYTGAYKFIKALDANE